MLAVSRPTLSIAARAYLGLVITAGTFAVGLSAQHLITSPFDPQWLWLCGLTLVSLLLAVRLPKVSANISVSETFVFAGTLLFGPAVGTVLVLLDAALIWIMQVRKAKITDNRILWHRMFFSLAAPALSIWISGTVLFLVMGRGPLVNTTLPQSPIDVWFFLGLFVFTVLYFILNSWLIAVAIGLSEAKAAGIAEIDRNNWLFAIALALDKSGGLLSICRIWRDNFSALWLNYVVGASIAALVVANNRTISPTSVALIVPLMLVLFYSFKMLGVYKEKVEEAEKRFIERIEEAESRLQEQKRRFLKTVGGLARYIEGKDSVSSEHIWRVQRSAMALADEIGVTDENERDALSAAALLHDTGKIGTPDHILKKPGPLTSSEFEKMKEHAAFGAEIIESLAFPYPVAPLVRHHHERWDGSGYPDGLAGDRIPLGARILAVVDSFDALTSDRQYRPRMTRQQAERIMRDGRGNHYDPLVVDAFLRILDKIERLAADEQTRTGPVPVAHVPTPVEVISATSAEDREFRELSRELPKATSIAAAADALFRHIRRVVPAASMALYVPRADGSMLDVAACSGAGASTIGALSVPIGERISGWAFAHKQVVVNSDATLELGPVARTFAFPLRYALVVPLIEGPLAVGVIGVFGSDPFEKDHQRLVETAATLFHSSFSIVSSTAAQAPSPQNSDKPRSKVH